MSKPSLDSFSVMTLNLRFGLADDGPNSWKFRKKRYQSLFGLYSPDFIGMQEANGFQVDFLQEILNDYKYIGRRVSADENWQHNIIFYKKIWQCQKSERLYLSETPAVQSKFSGSKWPRQVVIGDFKRDDQHIICMNTHFDFDSDVQVKSAQFILDKVKQQSSLYPIIITGDFNCEPQSPCYQQFTGIPPGKGLFKESFAGESVYTHHAFTGKNAGGHLDWILYKGNINILENKIVDKPFEGGYPSDHFPVFVKFRNSP